MANGYNSNHLIKLLYNELNLFSKLELEDAIAHNEGLRSEFLHLKEMISSFPKVAFFPKKSSIKNILLHSKSNSINAVC